MMFDYLIISAFNFFLLIAILILFISMTNNKTKCGNIYKKIAMQEYHDARIVNYEWPNVGIFLSLITDII